MLFASILCLSFSTATQDANANGETRSLTMHHAHTNELITITFKRDGSFDSAALEKLNWFLRDWRADEPTSMAPQLFDVIWFVYREVGASEPIKVMSAYRSPGTNAMLRRRSRAVAKESQHMRGNAMDIHIPGVSMARVREIGMRLQRGGVGYYPSAGSPFVHLDVGSVRSWPRMPREQLERLFPDGKTVHLPKDGIPLANYQAALAEVQARGGSALDYETVTTNRGKSLWALLFGGDEDEDIARDVGRGGRNARVATRGRGNAPTEQVAALPSSGDGPGAWGVAGLTAAPQPRVARAPVIATPTPEPESAAAPPTPAPAVPPSPAVAEPQRAPLQVASLPIPPIRPKGAQFASLVAATEPLPPIRPSGIGLTSPVPNPTANAAPVPAPAEPVTLAAAPNMPLPPVRPAAAAPAEPAPVAAPAPVAVANVPMPPLRPAAPAALEAPVAVAAAPSPVVAPLPPLRPAMPAVVGSETALPSIVSRAPEPERPAAPLVQAYAAVPAPIPPSRPVPAPATAAVAPSLPAAAPSAVPPPVTPTQTSPPPVRPREARPAFVPRPTNPMAMVMAQPAVETRPSQVIQVAEPPVGRELRSAVTASPLAAVGTAAAPASGFTGSFIRPLGASFTRSGE
ncbi:MAG: DUF882 domain-containing protein [Beijerinckiaceae bacterium]|nr:DUF882 domain-containing protein [Beijerinckiaceae bacterium]MCZ8300882.1 DUF882 domain-containing protein [Beijerinckiaceae bacterium]